MAYLKFVFAFWFLVSFAGLVHCLDAGHCRCRVQTDSRIIGGKIAHKNSYPWMASIDAYHINAKRSKWLGETHKVQESHNCGATIINERWLVTAAHCTNDTDLQSLSIGFGNDNDLVKIFNAGRIKVKRKVEFPRFGSESSLSDDISLLELETPINFTSTVLPACLSVNYRSNESNRLVGTGYGLTDHYKFNLTSGLYYTDGKLHRYLKEVEMKDTSKTEALCHREQEKLCAEGVYNGEGTCNGDSGGPIHHIKNGRAYVVALTSLSNGSEFSKTEKNILNYCGKGGYQRISSYIDFIRAHVNIYCSDVGTLSGKKAWLK